MDLLSRNRLCMNGVTSGSSVCSRSDLKNWKRVTEAEVAVNMHGNGLESALTSRSHVMISKHSSCGTAHFLLAR